MSGVFQLHPGGFESLLFQVYLQTKLETNTDTNIHEHGQNYVNIFIDYKDRLNCLEIIFFGI